MRQAWRWYGPNDNVSLDDVRQAGATDIVTALHQAPPGAEWTTAAVAERKRLIEETPLGRSPLRWSVVESIPAPDDVKRLGGTASSSIDVWIASMEAVAANNVKTICYNFMPVLDWTRTDLAWPLPNGARALRFDQARLAAFDVHILKRKGAEADYSEDVLKRARALFEDLTQAGADELTRNIAAGLPGATSDSLDLQGMRDKLAAYAGIGAEMLRRNLIAFLERVAPVAEGLNVKLALHPDDPPRPLFGLPRIASTMQDYQALFDAVPSLANGICFCTGSLGVSPLNDLPVIARRFAPRIHFAHLRATRREADSSFYESDHLEGDVDMISVLRELLAEDRKRPAGAKIPFRPDHGHQMLDDLNKTTNPGYSAIGRLKGLAELRGAIKALETIA
ncbi:mannonate dehydratase [Methylocapsa sp. S129]|uniref:mannonate dehydratase n=1 Tax=Methylocapsa sp. S129 TaxID=1641869 RepID=UPI00131B6898|nr:mannonate dehydratase [Methylocapsa sp. S129]